MLNEASTYCRICGLDQQEPIWGEDGRSPTHNICDCCGAEFGYEDSLPEAARAYRKKWMAAGAHWFSPKAQPPSWVLEDQLANIPEAFR